MLSWQCHNVLIIIIINNCIKKRLWPSVSRLEIKSFESLSEDQSVMCNTSEIDILFITAAAPGME